MNLSFLRKLSWFFRLLNKNIIVFIHSKSCDVLISYGADADKWDDIKNTALHYASQNGYPEIVKLLIENGAFSDVINLNSETPLHLAAKSGSVECMKILIENGARLQARDKIGKTCLDKAIESYKKNACLTLLENKRFGLYFTFFH